jgi:siroheme synthase-like protein
MSLAYFPFLFNINGRKLLFIGGGRVAERKINAMLPMNPEITVITAEAAEGIAALAAENKITLTIKYAETEDIADCGFLFLCTNNKDLNARLARLARQKGIPVNVADDPSLCDFHLPAVHITEEGTLFSVSTQGENPPEAKRLRDRLKALTESGELS